MPSVAFRFPGGRYHATPWGSHVNEGQIEWPPSPWRLLRALIAVGYGSGEWNGNGPTPNARGLLEKLAGVLPHYALPDAVGAHSRHYMPLTKLKAPSSTTDTSCVLAHQLNAGPVVHGYKEDTTLVFDTWAEVTHGELVVTWNITLEEEERTLLGRLAERMGYLGRSESWVEARLLGADETTQPHNCIPCDVHPDPERANEQIALIAAQSAEVYRCWRAAALPDPDPERRLSAKEKKARKALENTYPLDLIAALQTDTRWLRGYGWNQPPGSRRVFYWRRRDALEAGAPKPARRHPQVLPVEAMLLSMTAASGSRGLLPHITRALPQGELLHDAFVFRSKGHLPVLSGCDAQRQPLRGAHAHVHVLHLDLDGDDHLDHILLWAPMMLNAHAQDAVRAVRHAWSKGNPGNLRLAVVGIGSCDDFRGLHDILGDRLRAVLGNLAAPGKTPGATNWISLTPFVPPRHLKKNGRNTLEGQIVEELKLRHLPAPSEINVIAPQESDLVRRQRHFIRRRRTARAPAPRVDIGFTLRLSFDAPVLGPICLGYGSHFGLGLFQVA